MQPAAAEFDFRAAREAMASGAPVGFDGVLLTSAKVHGRQMFFATDKRRDPIQRHHRNGTFYEEADLALIRQHFPAGGCFVDIGANVGNHSLYAATFLCAAKVIPFEPNPKVIRLLMANMALNGVTDVVRFDHLGMGLSDAPGEGFGVEERSTNLGAARLLEGEGDIPVTTGDLALTDEVPDFIKIDVEGMEIGVLNGLAETVKRCQPMMLVEVDEANYAAFEAWMAAHSYRALEVIQRYATNKNFLVGAVERVGHGAPVLRTQSRKE